MKYLSDILCQSCVLAVSITCSFYCHFSIYQQFFSYLLHLFPFTAVLVWLNYKNAYEYWTEQQMNLSSEVLTATQSVKDQLPQSLHPSSFSSVSSFYLQVAVDDMGICIPLAPFSLASQVTICLCSLIIIALLLCYPF